MAGKDFLGQGNDIFDDIAHTIKRVVDDVTKLQNVKQPTVPIYPKFVDPNPGDLPDDPVEGQFAIDGSADKAYFYSNGAWHKLGGQDTEWLIVDGFYQNDSPNPPFTFPFPPDAGGSGSNFPVKMSGSSDGIGGTFESENGRYTIDVDGTIHVPDGVWIILSRLDIQHPSGISVSTYTSFNMGIDGVGNTIGGTWRKNSPDINNVASFHNWYLTFNAFYQQNGGDGVVFNSQCDSALRGSINTVATITAAFFQLTPEFFIINI